MKSQPGCLERRCSVRHMEFTCSLGSEQHDKQRMFKPSVKNREDTCSSEPNCEVAPNEKKPDSWRLCLLFLFWKQREPQQSLHSVSKLLFGDNENDQSSHFGGSDGLEMNFYKWQRYIKWWWYIYYTCSKEWSWSLLNILNENSCQIRWSCTSKGQRTWIFWWSMFVNSSYIKTNNVELKWIQSAL